jgi:hypothetical protein
MTAKRRKGFVSVIILSLLFSFQCFADEILFQKQKVSQTGVVVGEDDQSVTIRFPKEAIKSINRSGDEHTKPSPGKVVWEEGKDYLILKIPRRSIRVVPQKTRAEGASEKIGKAETGSISGTPVKMEAHQELLKEEMGSVEGVIMWQGIPLKNHKVKIVLERYTGFSVAALKQWYAVDKKKSLPDKIVLETQTDSRGRYVFHEAPPGYYRLYWMPDTNTGWIHRLREKPDIEVVSGNRTVENVPEKKK